MTVKLYRAMLWDNLEHGSLRLWTAYDQGAGSTARYLHEGKYVKDGNYSLKWTSDIGATPSGYHYINGWLDYSNTLFDLSDYTHMVTWLYCGCTTDPPKIYFKFRNNGTYTPNLAVIGETKNGWALVKSDISGQTRDNVDLIQFIMLETDYGSSENVDFYFDTICFINANSGGYLDLTNTDEDVQETYLFRSPEITFGDGIRPTFEGGIEGRTFTISGVLVETTESALDKDKELEEFIQQEDTLFLETDYIGALCKVNAYNSHLTTGRIYTIPYTIGLNEYFGTLYKER